MGSKLTTFYDTLVYPDVTPPYCVEPTFDPQLGLGPRKERVMQVSEQELRALKIPKDKWDFCAHKLVEVHKCKGENYPFMWRCKAQSHEASLCNYEDHILRMKEYERERRLRHRQKRIQQAQQAQAA